MSQTREKIRFREKFEFTLVYFLTFLDTDVVDGQDYSLKIKTKEHTNNHVQRGGN